MSAPSPAAVTRSRFLAISPQRGFKWAGAKRRGPKQAESALGVGACAIGMSLRGGWGGGGSQRLGSALPAGRLLLLLPYPRGGVCRPLPSVPSALPFQRGSTQEGEYIKNPMGQICRYSFTSQEVVYLSAQIDVVDGGQGAPYTVTVTHNDETIFEAVDVLGSCPIRWPRAP